MTDQEMADALKARGWRVEEPWTQENCKHPMLARMGSGSLSCDGSGHMEWHCRLCGKFESYSTAADPERVKQQYLCWN